jgi:putative heme-binding domain-containing protein
LGERLPRFILESLVDPGAQVAPGFGMTMVTLIDDSVVSGNLISDTPDHVRLLMADKSEQEIPREQVASRTPAMSAMPPMGALLKQTELRDLMAYLQTL